MKVKARLALEDGDKETAGKAAQALSEAGFNITAVSGRGVSFEGDFERFRSFFQKDLKHNGKNVAFESEPDLSKTLEGIDANVYFPTQPEYFP